MIEHQRDRWSSRATFLVAAIGCAVGLGNIWRFPHMAYNGGGGAFFIPYFLALFTAGIPLLMLENGLGHRMQSASPVAMARAHKKSELIGWWAALSGLFITFYYTVLLAWVSIYVIDLVECLVTRADKLPWQQHASAWDYLSRNVISGDKDIEAKAGDFSNFHWKAFLLNMLLWAFIYNIIRKGVKGVGKQVWFIVLFPYLLLFILFAVAMQLPGASSGLNYYLTPRWDVLSTSDGLVKAFSSAYSQMFFSLSIGFGIMMSFSSFLPKRSDITNNSRITAFANAGTEFFAGFITFAVIGFLALQQGVFPSDAIGGSFGIAFVTYPTAIENFSSSVQINALLGLAFFSCLLMLGNSSAYTLVEATTAGAVDKFGWDRKIVARVLCGAGVVVGGVFCFPTGLDLLDTADHFLADYGLLMVGFAQCITVGWFYGAEKLRGHLNEVSETKTTRFWTFCIKFFTPAVLLAILLYQIFHKELEFVWNAEKEMTLGNTFTLIGFCVLLTAIVLSFVLTKRKAANPAYAEAPPFDYEDKNGTKAA